jgi:threonine/homoserine/homoserine lactone efflux protein
MVRMVATFAPVAALLTLTPGAATALVIRAAVRDGRRGALRTTAGNSLGILVWGVLAAAGVAAVVAASAAVFTAVKLVGAVVLVVLGIQAWRGGRRPGVGAPAASAAAGHHSPTSRAVRDGLVSSLANPKLAVFFVALFPQFVPAGAPVLPAALLMVAIIVCFDVVWFSVLAWLVGRAQRAFEPGAWLRRAERLTGVVLVGLGLRLAVERR